ncbi:MAG: hypothetical protein AYK19_14790 [Theionarchaea archaeon DG-70-1]|nr:MAG: hypothetical protein AYK19_14790 [Theionarchaea archaeon DG-70-1]
MMTKKFSKCKEDFICEKCGQEVRGTGYTNHCPTCLWSKHVDINPGDRQCTCGGMMEPVRTEYKGEFIIVHHCIKCGIEKRNRAAENDNKELLFNLLSTK